MSALTGAFIAAVVAAGLLLGALLSNELYLIKTVGQPVINSKTVVWSLLCILATATASLSWIRLRLRLRTLAADQRGVQLPLALGSGAGVLLAAAVAAMLVSTGTTIAATNPHDCGPSLACARHLAALHHTTMLLPAPASGWTVHSTTPLQQGVLVNMRRGADYCTFQVLVPDPADPAFPGLDAPAPEGSPAGGNTQTSIVIRGGPGVLEQTVASLPTTIVLAWTARWSEGGQRMALCSGDVPVDALLDSLQTA